MSTKSDCTSPAAEINPMLDAGQVAEVLGIERNTVLGWAKTGRLPPTIRMGRVIRWSRAAVKALAEGGLVPTGGGPT